MKLINIHNIKEFLTICIPTNFVPTSPSSVLVKYVLDRMLKTIPEFKECPIVISCDVHPELRGDVEWEYVRNLEQLQTDRIKVVHSQQTVVGQGQRTSFLNMTDNVHTKYMLHFEHDWVFNEYIDFLNLLNVMETYDYVNFIAFNQTGNHKRGTDYILETASDIEGVDLLRSARYSNNPHLARKTFWDVRIRDIITNAPPCSKNVTERPVFSKYVHAIKKKGFLEANKDWGVYVYGEMDRPPTITHINGKKWRPAK